MRVPTADKPGSGKWIHLAAAAALALAAGGMWAGANAGANRAATPFTLTKHDGTFSLRADQAPLRDILRKLEADAGLKLTIDANLAEVVTVDIKNASPEDLLKTLTKSGSFVYESDGQGGYRLVAATASSQQKIAVPQAAEPASGDAALALSKGQLSNVKAPSARLMARDAQAILLENAIIDTAAFAAGSKVQVPETLRSKANERNYIVQFDHRIRPADKMALAGVGVEVNHYIPNNALFVRTDGANVDAVRNLPGVVLVEPYHPYYKLSRDLVASAIGAADAAQTARAQMGAYHVTMVNAKVDAEGALTPSVTKIRKQTSAGNVRVVTVEAPPANVNAIAASGDVLWVEPAVPRQPANDLAAKRVRGANFRKLHPTLNGEGVVVGVTDSGVDFNHAAFALNPDLPTSTNLNTRIVAYFIGNYSGTSDGIIGDINGHGTHVSGSILGNGGKSTSVAKAPGSGTAPYATNQFAGVAPAAKLVMVEDFNSFTDDEQLALQYAAGARMNNNSWGASAYQYNGYSALWDSLVADMDPVAPGDQQFIAFFAAGNDGNGNNNGRGGAAGSVGTPGNAKNVITVGAVENLRLAENYVGARQETDADWQVAYFSSRGPVSATDYRRKPDVVAPGGFVLSVQSRETNPDDLVDPLIPHRDYRYGNLDSGTNYAFFSGTSMATPITTGAGALLFQFYTNRFGRAPSPAMMKAMLVNGAKNINSIVYPKGVTPLFSGFYVTETPVYQGYGMVDVVRSADGLQIRSTDENILLDESDTTPADTDANYEYSINLKPGEGGLKITLAWTDFPGSAGSARALVNDLDLLVYGPNGLAYAGNVYSLDGVHSLKIPAAAPFSPDGGNNVEQVIIPDAIPGQYTVRVLGYNVVVGPQPFALAIYKGAALEGRAPGNQPAVALDTNNNPVIAYSAPDTGGNEQIFVRQWVGPTGDPTTFGSWRRLEDQWYGIRDSANSIDSGNNGGTGISRSLEPSRNPSVAADGQNVYVAWEQHGQLPEDPARIYFRKFDGSDWIELNNSAKGDGMSGPVSAYDALDPVVRVQQQHLPVVAWRQTVATGTKILLALHDGANWVGLGGSSTSNGIPGVSYANNMDMIIDSSGAPVVAWEELLDQRIHVKRWFNNAWTDLGTQGSAPYASSPRLAVDSSGGIYLTWVQYPTGTGTNYFMQVYASKFSGGWQAIGGSTTYPGVSENFNFTNSVIGSPSIGVDKSGQVFVSWLAGAGVENSLLVRKYSGGQWQGVAGAGVPPGVGFTGGSSTNAAMAVDTNGTPFVVFANNSSGESEVMTYALSSDRTAPQFFGIQTAIGNTNNGVVVGWLPAVDSSTTIVYKIYRSPNSSPCGTTPACDANSVFGNLVATVTNQLDVAVAGVTNGRVYCWGVRATDNFGNTDQNTVMLSAGPAGTGGGDDDVDCLSNALELQAGTDTCLKDTDGDGMYDGWEWAFSTNNPAHTNALAMSPIDNGTDNVRTGVLADGNPLQDPLADLDGDGLSNFDEFNWWAAAGYACPASRLNSPDPTRFDTDGDGMGDGWEVQFGLSPISTNGNNGANGDPDGDGVINIVEYQYGSNPFLADTDGDTLTDSNEVYAVFSDPTVVDSDHDGLDDPFEVSIGTSPAMADSATNSLLSDGDVWQLGWTNRASAITFDFLVRENFETATRTNWTHNAASALLPFDLWHVSSADPQPAFTNRPVNIKFMYQRTTNLSYRMAHDVSATPSVSGTNLNATYNRGFAIQCALNSPVFDATTNSCLFMQWNEYYETEPFYDTVQVQGRSSGNTNWQTVGQQFWGQSIATNPFTATTTNGWAHRIVDLSRYAGQAGVQVRFLFTAQNSINNNFRGWWVDDVYIYGGVVVSGWVRDVRGRPVDGGQVQAIGQGGVTNFIDGHKVSGLGRLFGVAKTTAEGSFLMSGLPHGRLLLKAGAPNLAAEFYNGPIFAGTYAFGAGTPANFGVADVDLAKGSPNGLVDLRSVNSFLGAWFELDQGKGRAQYGVAGPAATLKIDNQPVSLWNGSTSAPSFVAWSTVPSASTLTNNRPDWELNPVAPRLLGDVAPGAHWLFSTLAARMPPPVLDLREGENAVVELATNQANGSFYVYSEIGGTYNVWLDGSLTTSTVPATLSVKAGTHYLSLLPPASNGMIRPAIKKVVARAGALPARIMFSADDLTLYPGTIAVQTVDIQGNAITGAQVYVNGAAVSSNDVVAGYGLTTPTIVKGLQPGNHYVSTVASGYRPSEMRAVSIFSGSSNVLTYILYDADRDYDLVGDPIEISGYTNVFAYSRSNDPDGDGINNLQEYDLFREFNVRINPFIADTDGDGLSDGAEVAYDGQAGRLALTMLATNAVQDAAWAAAFFSGKYLAGVDYFSLSNAVASIAGDRFEAPVVIHPVLPVPTRLWAQSVFTNIAPLVRERAISKGHNPETLVFSDTRPDLADTDGDGMWDGFEATYATMPSLSDPNTIIRILDPLEEGNADGDPDADGLTNYQEFLGPDGVTNLVWSDPTKTDSDGDGIPDGWETQYGLNPSNADDVYADPDGDNLINLGEYLSGTDPHNPDSDGDFLPDGAEVIVFNSDPRNYDTDGDGLIDGREVWDKNMDGVPDGGFFPMWSGGDLDGDGYVDGPTDWDTDGDGMPDGFEVLWYFGIVRPQMLDPYNPFDGAVDSDNDGLSNLQEYLVQDGLFGNAPGTFDTNYNNVVWQYATDPFNPDSDNDGIPDGFEVLNGLAPVDPSPNSVGTSIGVYPALLPEGDVDGDGLWNVREYDVRFRINALSPTNPAVSLSTHPWNPDTDGDGLGDGEEDRVYRSNPIVQDTDGDRLTDGVSYSGKPGEVETAGRRSEYQYVPGSISWQQAMQDAQIPHPVYPWIMGHLAAMTTTQDLVDAVAALGGADDVAIGGFGLPPSGIGILGGGQYWHWVTYEFPSPDFVYGLFDDVVTNYLTLNNDGSVNLTQDIATGGYLIEWENVPQTEAHYGGATNDLWILYWPHPTLDPPPGINNFFNRYPSLPYWVQIEPDTNYPLPEPRWGHASSYVPVYEDKNTRNAKAANSAAYRLLMDNRRFNVFGGTAGVNRYSDVWEYNVAFNRWEKSQAPLNAEFGALGPAFTDGLSDTAVFVRYSGINTKTPAPACPCANVPYNCDGEGFGEPKNRPWVVGLSDRSFDITYMLAGMDNLHLYYNGAAGYKVTDDPRSITERSSTWDSAGYVGLAQPANTLNTLVDNNPVQIRIGKGPTNVINGVTNILQGFAGFTINPMPFFLTCERIDRATLRLNVGDPPAALMPVTLMLEVNNNQNHAEAYPGGARPDQRVVSGANFRSTPITVNIAAGFTGIMQIDVTTQFIEILDSGFWDATRMGFLITNQTFTTDFAGIRQGDTTLEVTYTPGYKLPPILAGGLSSFMGFNQSVSGLPTNGAEHTVAITVSNANRKSAAMAYDYGRDRFLVFGGIDGRAVLGDAYEAQFNPGNTFTTVLLPQPLPPARWGHQIIYDDKHGWYLLFGGFDKDHHPLNDTWIYIPNATLGLGSWVNIPRQATSDQVPRPRGGHSMMYYGDFDYNRGVDGYCLWYNPQMAVLFGGTDGRTCFNDTWIFDSDTFQWTLVQPSGIWAGNAFPAAPPPRAFASMSYAQNLLGENTEAAAPPGCSVAAGLLFGGHVGTLPTGLDSDFDLVDDGVEHEINGSAQRDPRVNRMFLPGDQRPETLPYNFVRIGSVPFFWPLNPRGAIADFESIDFSNATYAANGYLPYEAHPYGLRINAFLSGTEPGVDANAIQQTQLWWHQHAGSPYDSKDVWELGQPDPTTAGTNAVPRQAYSGRWCYGTKLNGFYPNSANMELYSPLLNLEMPVLDSTSLTPNYNEFFLVFHEWLDLGDSNDTVRIEMIRPVTGSDILSRRTGVGKPIINVLPSRNNAYNTKGEWRRVTVPIVVAANDTNIFFRFSLLSDSNQTAGGWYIDDVAIIQGGTINGSLTNLPYGQVALLGINSIGTVFTNTLTDASGFFQFGLLPDGDYQIGSGGGIIGQFSVGSFNGWNNFIGSTPAPQVIVSSIVANPGGGMVVSWPTTPSLSYRLEYSDVGVGGPYSPLVTLTAYGQQESYIDYGGTPARFYRVVFLNNL